MPKGMKTSLSYTVTIKNHFMGVSDSNRSVIRSIACARATNFRYHLNLPKPRRLFILQPLPDNSRNYEFPFLRLTAAHMPNRK